MTKTKEENLCPMCQTNELNEVEVRNSLSRMDNETYICNDCGMIEAVSLTRESKIGNYWVMKFPVMYPDGIGIFKNANMVASRRSMPEAIKLAKYLDERDGSIDKTLEDEKDAE